MDPILAAIVEVYQDLATRADHDLRFAVQDRLKRAMSEEEQRFVDSYIKDLQISYSKLAAKAQSKRKKSG